MTSISSNEQPLAAEMEPKSVLEMTVWHAGQSESSLNSMGLLGLLTVIAPIVLESILAPDRKDILLPCRYEHGQRDSTDADLALHPR